MTADATRGAGDGDCWRGRDDPRPFVPGLPETVPESDTVDALFEAMACCTRCDLARERLHVVPGVGHPNAEVMLIGEAPGAREDESGEPFVGRAGSLLQRLLDVAGLDRESVFITNVVACRPPRNRTPRVQEVRAHEPWLEGQIRLVHPELIVTLGRVALTYFVPGAKITARRGRPTTIERDGRRIRLLPALHPAAALRRPEMRPALERTFSRIAELTADARRRGGSRR